MRTQSNQYQLQNKINQTYERCESLKDEIALLNAMYNSTVSCLNVLVNETGLNPTFYRDNTRYTVKIKREG